MSYVMLITLYTNYWHIHRTIERQYIDTATHRDNIRLNAREHDIMHHVTQLEKRNIQVISNCARISCTTYNYCRHPKVICRFVR